MFKMLTIASMSLALTAGAALAQATSSTDKNAPTQDDQTMMESWRGQEGVLDAFFMDDTLAELRSQEEITANWANLSAEQQETIKADCDQAMLNRGVHGATTISLCTQIGEL